MNGFSPWLLVAIPLPRMIYAFEWSVDLGLGQWQEAGEAELTTRVEEPDFWWLVETVPLARERRDRFYRLRVSLAP